MNKDILLSLILLLLLLHIGKAGSSEKASVASSQSAISLTPTTLDTFVSQSFALNLSISDVTGLYLWVVTIQWNATVLNLTSYSEGPFLRQGGHTTFMVGKTEPGTIVGLTCSLTGSVPGVSGNGTLTSFQFNALAAGTTSIAITFSDLLDSNGSSMPHDTGGSSVTVSRHDVWIMSMLPLKTVVGQGFALTLNTTVLNNGYYDETFNVTIYANTTAVNQTLVTLTSGNSTTIIFTWNTTGFAKGNYTIEAVADTVPGEDDVGDNNCTGGWIIVAMLGDLTGDPNGYPDGKCNMVDVGNVAKLFGINYTNPTYNPNFDIDYDMKINMVDVGTVARHFGEVDP